MRRESQTKFSLCCEGVECAPSRRGARGRGPLGAPRATGARPNRSLTRPPSATADASRAARRVLLNESHHDITVDVPIAMDASAEAIKETAETLRKVEKITHDALHAH